MTKKPTLDLSRYIPALLTFASNRLSHGASETYRHLFGIGISEWRVISLLAAEPDIPATRMCQVIGFDKGLASRVIKKLADQGIVSVAPDATHGSRSLVRLTREGDALHDQVLEVVSARERILHEAFSPQEIDTLIELLHRVYEQADTVNAYDPITNKRGAKARGLVE